jgi:hypothetical protein
MVQHIIGQSHRTPYPCLPVDHGQLLDPSLNWLQPTQNELWDTDALVATLPSMDSSEALRHFVPARLTQCQGLNPQSTSILLHLYHGFLARALSLSYGLDKLQWLDPSFLTEPPCKTLGMYTLQNGHLTALTRLHETTGVKVSQFMEALDPHGRDFLEPWKVLAEGMMLGIRKHYVFLKHTQNNIHPLAKEAFSCSEKIFYDDWE